MIKQRLSHLEDVIGKNLRNFYELGRALRVIRDERLYHQLLYKRFDTYVKTRWDIGKAQAYRLIEAASIIENLSPIGDIPLPENESQTRPLAKLKKIEQRKIWMEFIASGMELSAVNIRKFILKRTGGVAKGKPCDRTGLISVEYKEAVLMMLEQIRTAQNDHWQSTSREAGLFWIGIMKGKILENVK